jgi:antitoxin ParD1/3/4
MEATRRLEIELPEELADAVRAKVESGEFGSESEVVRAALDLLDEQGAEPQPDIDAQLAAGYDAWKANPTAVYTLEEVERHLNEQRAKFRG